MFTFLVSLGVVSAAIAAVVYVVLSGPDQPKTARRPARSKRRRRPTHTSSSSSSSSVPSAAPVSSPAAVAHAQPNSDIMRLRVMEARRTTLWVRIRASVALVVLVAVLGALVALAVVGLVLGAGLALRSITG